MKNYGYLNLRAIASALAFALTASACHSNGIVKSTGGTIRHPTYCGGELSDAQLRDFLEAVRASFVTTDFHAAMSNQFVGQRPAMKDWKIIASSIEGGKLESVGWRGCILGSGKAAFQSGLNQPFLLYTFDSSRDW